MTSVNPSTHASPSIAHPGGHFLLLLAVVVTAILLPVHSAWATCDDVRRTTSPTHIALVIGNQEYVAGGSLSTPRSDTSLVAAELEDAGYDVRRCTDLTHDEMEDELRGVIRASNSADVVLVYYAGHGMQISGGSGDPNYLLPVDFTAETAAEARQTSVSVARLVSDLEDSGARNKVLVIDACRNPTTLRSWTSSIRSSVGESLSLSSITSSGVAVVNSTRSGAYAYDVDPTSRSNSPFAVGFASALSTGGTAINIFDAVTDYVERVTGNESNGMQTPEILSLGVRLSQFSLVAGGSVQVRPPTPAPTPPSPRRPTTAPTGFVYIAPGTFTMGSPTSEEGRWNDESQHQVTLTRGFYLQAHEVTQGEWVEVMGENPSGFPDCGDRCPVERVSWEDAVLYANALSRSEGLSECYGSAGSVRDGGTVYDCEGYRLPTEAEWEYAARAGTSGARYGALNSIAWHADNSGGSTHPVGSHRSPNAWGLHDMLGNVYEWTHDVFESYGGRVTDPSGPSTDSFRVLRGGSWDTVAIEYPLDGVRAARRWRNNPAFRSNTVGFRLARSAP